MLGTWARPEGKSIHSEYSYSNYGTLHLGTPYLGYFYHFLSSIESLNQME